VRYVGLGTSGLTVSRIALGMMSYGDPAAVPWYLPQDAAEPIVGATRPAHLDDALAAVDLTLSPVEVARLAAPYRPRAPYGYS
jgi:aryl-alcohol dehydrogenase-like predicted oxidoreductase